MNLVELVIASILLVFGGQIYVLYKSIRYKQPTLLPLWLFIIIWILSSYYSYATGARTLATQILSVSFIPLVVWFVSYVYLKTEQWKVKKNGTN